MYQYPKQILIISQQIQSYVDAKMSITSLADIERALTSVGFYRLRGTCVPTTPEYTTAQSIPRRKFWMQTESLLRLFTMDYIKFCLQ